MEHMRDGLYISPDDLRMELSSILSKVSDSKLKAAVNSYLSWMRDNEFRLSSTLAGEVWLLLLEEKIKNRVDGPLFAYDAICREIARRWYLNEFEEDENSSNRKSDL
jgi:hypothetical protein